MIKFCKDQTGAVTTDWVVLVVALVGLTAGVLSLISTGTLDVAAANDPAMGIATSGN